MVFANLRREERLGLGIALALHLALGAALLVQPAKRTLIPPAEKMTVNLATDVGLAATAPEPVPDSAAAVAPTLAPEPAPPAEAAPQPAPYIPIERPQPVATTPPRPKPVPRATTAPQPRPAPRATATPRPAATLTEQRRRPDTPASQSRSTPKPAGGSRIGADFLPGAGTSTTSRETRVPASQIGASAKASITQAIARQIKPHWSAPQGADAELLVTILAFRLNPDGSLSGTPRVVSQSGETDANAPQKKLHAERAIRAVQLAAPFDLPNEFYDAWKSINGARFDRNLSR